MLTTQTFEPATGVLPRRLSDEFLWTGGCLDANFKSTPAHGHIGVFVVRTGTGKSYMVDTGHPSMWEDMSKQVEEFLDGEPLDYIFVTHAEIPHAGLLGKWLKKYPQAIAVGDARDFHLYFPNEAAEGRFLDLRAGDALDLGDRQLVFTPAVWRDLPTTLWAYDTKLRVLYVSDGFGFLHPHREGHCDLLTTELPEPDIEMASFFNSRALFWTQFLSAPETYGDIDELLKRADPLIIAPAHGAVIDNIDEMLAFFKKSMVS